MFHRFRQESESENKPLKSNESSSLPSGTKSTFRSIGSSPSFRDDSPPPPLPSRNYRKLSPIPGQSSTNKIVASVKPQQRDHEQNVLNIDDAVVAIQNSKTMDCSTQTTNSLSRRNNSSRGVLSTPKFIRKKRQAELECDRLSQDLVNCIDDANLSSILSTRTPFSFSPDENNHRGF